MLQGLGVPGFGHTRPMAIGTSLFLIAVGAILKYAVNDSIEQVDLTTVEP